MKRLFSKYCILSVVLAAVLLSGIGCTRPQTETIPSDVSVRSAVSSDVPVSEQTSAESDDDAETSPEVPQDSSKQESSAVTESSAEEPSASDPSEDVSEESEKPVSDVSDEQSSAVSSEPSEEISQISDASSVESSDEEPQAQQLTEALKKKYFVRRLSRSLQSDFARLYQAAAAFEKDVRFMNTIKSEELDEMMFLLNYDCPELIHVSGDYMPYYSDNYCEYVSGVRFTYNMTEEQYPQACEALDSFARELTEKTKGMTAYETEYYVYQLLFDTVIFDDYATHAGSVYGALIEHRARCEGISKAFAWCMQQCGMECLTVAGTPLWENTGAFAGHSWNILLLEDTYYHVDVAADNLRSFAAEKTYPLYGFLNAGDARMERTHRINDIFLQIGVPSCPSEEMNYHVLMGQYIENDTELHQQFETILQHRYTNGEEQQLSVRLGTEAAYQDLLDNWEPWLAQFCEKEGYPLCDSTIYYNDVSLAVVIDMKPQP